MIDPNEAVNAYAVAKSSRFRLTDEEADNFLQECINHQKQKEGNA